MRASGYRPPSRQDISLEGGTNRIRYEVNEQTRSLLHEGSATVSTIAKCVSRSVGKMLKGQEAQGKARNYRSSPSLINLPTSKKLSSSSSDGENPYHPGGSAILPGHLQSSKSKSKPKKPFAMLSQMNTQAGRYAYDESLASPQEMRSSQIPQLPEDTNEVIASVRITNRSMRDVNNRIKPNFERLYRTRKECKVVAEASHPDMYQTLSEKREKIRAHRLQKCRRRERLAQNRSVATLLSNSVNMISQQVAEEKVRHVKMQQYRQAANDADQLRRHRRYLKNRLNLFHNRQKKEKQLKFQRTKRNVDKLLQKNYSKESYRLHKIKSSKTILRTTSKPGFVMAKIVDKYGRSRDTYLPKLGKKGNTGKTLKRGVLNTSSICVDGFTLYDDDEFAEERARYLNSSEIMNSVTLDQGGNGSRNSAIKNQFNNSSLSYQPSTSSALEHPGFGEPVSSRRLNSQTPVEQHYGRMQPWGGVYPGDRRVKSASSSQSRPISIPRLTGAFSIGNEGLEGAKDNSATMPIEGPDAEGWEPMEPSPQALSWSRVQSANSRISAHGSLSSVESSGEVPVRMTIGSPFNAKRHYGKLVVPLSPPFQSTGGRSNSTMFDPVIGSLPAPWGAVRPEHQVSRGKSDPSFL